MVTDGRVMVLDGVTAGVVETIGVEAGVTGEGGNRLHKHITMNFYCFYCLWCNVVIIYSN
jgi:hypothetical protein